jgi:hypothetical protein
MAACDGRAPGAQGGMMRIHFPYIDGRGFVPHVITEASHVTYPHVIIEAHRAKYLGSIGYTSIRDREATPGEVQAWQANREP